MGARSHSCRPRHPLDRQRSNALHANLRPQRGGERVLRSRPSRLTRTSRDPFWSAVRAAPAPDDPGCTPLSRTARPFGRAEARPGEHRQVKIDRRGAQRIDRVGKLYAQGISHVELPRLDDEPLDELGVYAPVARFVCIGEGRASDRLAKPHVVELGGPGLGAGKRAHALVTPRNGPRCDERSSRGGSP